MNDTTRMTNTTLAPERYFELIDVDTERLAEMGERGLGAAVPSCPGWVVGDVLRHTAQVYEHKAKVMADNAWPDPWPPAEFAEREPVDFLREAKDDLFREFALHDVGDVTTTFSEDDSTVMFWVRRMALEVAVHRYDGELAHAAATDVSDDLSLDGVDELLRLFLADNDLWSQETPTKHPVEAVVAVEAGGLRWVCDVQELAVNVTAEPTPAQATVAGDPAYVFLWLWGRVPDSAVELTGDLSTMAHFRGRLMECTL